MQIHTKSVNGALKDGYDLLEQQFAMQKSAAKKPEAYSTKYDGVAPLLVGAWVDIEKFKPISGNILVEFPSWSGTGFAKTNSGIEIDTTYFPDVHAPRRAKVLRTCDGLDDLVGRNVYFSYLTFGCCSDYEYGYLYFEQGDRKFGVMPFERVICSELNGEIVCHNGSILALPIQRDLKEIDNVTVSGVTESGIQVVDLDPETHNSKEAIVYAVGENSELKVGDRVIMDTACDIDLEHEYNQTLDKRVFYVLEANVLCVLNSGKPKPFCAVLKDNQLN